VPWNALEKECSFVFIHHLQYSGSPWCSCSFVCCRRGCDGVLRCAAPVLLEDRLKTAAAAVQPFQTTSKVFTHSSSCMSAAAAAPFAATRPA
jgi:hypothetical protein